MLPVRAAHAEILTRSKSWETVRRCVFSSLAGCADHARDRPETPYAFCFFCRAPQRSGAIVRSLDVAQALFTTRVPNNASTPVECLLGSMYRLTPSMGTGSKQREGSSHGRFNQRQSPAGLTRRECEQRAEKERDPSIKLQLLEEARRWLALAELCGEPRAVAASVGGLFPTRSSSRPACPNSNSYSLFRSVICASRLTGGRICEQSYTDSHCPGAQHPKK
jgi:hypothetical protein